MPGSTSGPDDESTYPALATHPALALDANNALSAEDAYSVIPFATFSSDRSETRKRLDQRLVLPVTNIIVLHIIFVIV
jgi:hypothetical protein